MTCPVPGGMTCRVPGGTMAYVDEGTGPPVVLVHGTPSSSSEWAEVTERLKRSYRVLAPDHLGFGESERPADWRTYSLPWHTENFRSWLDQQQLGRYHLVVHDFGGPIALPVALQAPEQLLSLTIVQSWLWSMALDPAFAQNMRRLDTGLMRFMYLWGNFSARAMVKLSWGRRLRLTAPVHQRFIAQFPTRASRAGTWGFARSLVHEAALMETQGEQLYRFASTPTLLVWGLADRMVTKVHFDRWRERLPHAQVKLLEDVGHFPQVEAPAELSEALERHFEASVQKARPAASR